MNNKFSQNMITMHKPIFLDKVIMYGAKRWYFVDDSYDTNVICIFKYLVYIFFVLFARLHDNISFLGVNYDTNVICIF